MSEVALYRKRQTGFVRTAAERVPKGPVLLAFLCGFTVPLKAARLDLAGLSVYATYVAAAVVVALFGMTTLRYFVVWFARVLAVLFAFGTWGVVRGVGPVQPLLTLAKLSVAFVVAAAFGVLIVRASAALYAGLLTGLGVTVAYMGYQLVSSLFFGFRLPFTTSDRFQIGLGLSRRYGLPRVTGFTEEPSFVATMIVGSTLLLIAYATRTSKRWMLSSAVMLGAAGTAMSTSNNFLATTVILAGFWPLIRRRRVALLFATYYAAALLITPFVLMRDLTFFARFSAFDIFRRSTVIEQVLGRGVGSYPQYFELNRVQFAGADVDSLASLWGGLIFEGGIVLAAVMVYWLGRVLRGAGWREGLALVAILLMLSNFNSPWWPIVSLALGQCLIFREREFYGK